MNDRHVFSSLAGSAERVPFTCVFFIIPFRGPSGKRKRKLSDDIAPEIHPFLDRRITGRYTNKDKLNFFSVLFWEVFMLSRPLLDR
ncbi:MAG: hypothetical protein ACLSVU_10140, partial [Christensenellales bacterium]